jgi:hypothetical protein
MPHKPTGQNGPTHLSGSAAHVALGTKITDLIDMWRSTQCSAACRDRDVLWVGCRDMQKDLDVDLELGLDSTLPLVFTFGKSTHLYKCCNEAIAHLPKCPRTLIFASNNISACTG